MSGTQDARAGRVLRLMDVARRVHQGRAALLPALVESTGLSPEGVELGFESLELQASVDELHALVSGAGEAAHVHVVLSANVFVAPLRALALALAAAPRVTVRASPRDPVLTRALVEALSDPAVTVVDERDPRATGADVVHVYGRDETIAQVRAQVRAGVRVRGHGAGLGVALVSPGAPGTAVRLARDVVTFDQRGCLSPRVALVLGDAAQARAFASELHDALDALGAVVPRGRLSTDEAVDAARWRDAIEFAGELRSGADHAVGVVDGETLVVPPSGRHVQVLGIADRASVRRVLAPIARLVVAVGTDDGAGSAGEELGLPHARFAALGCMQRPPLDGPVDRRRGDAVT